jgi:hypothetical protein
LLHIDSLPWEPVCFVSLPSNGSAHYSINISVIEVIVFMILIFRISY